MAVSLPFALTRDDSQPLCEQLRVGFGEEIRAGRLDPGARLPSTRRVAEELGVNRQTVVEAYRRMEQDGLVEQRVGSGTYVLEADAPARAPAPARRRREGLASAAVRGFDGSQARRELPPARRDAIDLAAIAPDEQSFPADELGACLQSALKERGAGLLGYGPVAGDPRLREALAARLCARGLAIEASGLVIVGGAQQGLDLVLRATADAGDLAIAEAPTYHLGLELMRFHGLELETVPLQPGEQPGTSRLDAGRLETLLARGPVLAYSMPSYQNPTGLSLDLDSRRLLAAACADAGTLLVEDDYEADLAYEGERLPPVAALPEAGEVAYVGTLSKALCPGLRVGWVAGSPELLDRLIRVKRVSDLSGSPLLQAAAAGFLASGAYDRHLAKVVEVNRERMRVLREVLAAELPDGCESTAPRGGHALWVRLPPGLSARAVAEAAGEAGVVVSPGDLFETEPGAEEGLRLSLARASTDEIPRGVSALAKAIRAVSSRRADASRRSESPLRV